MRPAGASTPWLVAWTLLLTSPAAHATTTGYRLIAERESAPPELGGTTVFSAPADDQEVVVPLPFPVRVYDRSATSLRVSVNGALSLETASSIGATNDAPGDPATPNALVAAFWDDLVLRRPTARVSYVIEGQAPARRFVVRWAEVERYAGPDGPLGFAVALAEGGSGEVELRYDATNGAVPGVGWSATVVLEDERGGGPYSPVACRARCADDALLALAGRSLRLARESGPSLALAWPRPPVTLGRGATLPLELTLVSLHARLLGPATVTLEYPGGARATVGTLVSVAPFSSLTLTATVTVPPTLPLGNGRLSATLELAGDDDPLDDRVEVDVRGVDVAPNLTLDALVVTVAERHVRAAARVASRGGRAAPPTSVRLVLGTNPFSSGRDTSLTEQRVEIRTSSTIVLEAELPDPRARSERFLGVVVDPDDLIAELDESDNARTAAAPLPEPTRGPRLLTTRLPRAVVGVRYQADLEVDAPDGARLTLDGTVPGLALSDHTLSGTPTVPGVFALPFTIGQAPALVGTSTLSLAVVRGNVPLAVHVFELPDATRGSPYAVTLVAEGEADGPLRWRGLQVPDGLELQPSGELQGTPQRSGSFVLQVAVADARTEVMGRLSLQVRAPLGARFADVPLPRGRRGEPYRALLEATDPAPDLRVRLVDGALPVGLSLSSTGALAGVPEVGGRARFVVALERTQATGAPLIEDLAAFELDVDANEALGLVVDPAADLRPGDQLLLRARATSPSTPPWTWEGSSVPEGLTLTFDERTGTLTLAGAPTSQRAGAVLFTLRDAAGRAGKGVFGWAFRDDANPAASGCSALHSDPSSAWLGLLIVALGRARARTRPARPRVPRS